MLGEAGADNAAGRRFALYLRTGRRISAERGIEVKFNPYHDPEDGRFTFKPGGGALSGNGGPRITPGSRRDPAPVDSRVFDPHHPRNQSTYTVKTGDSLTKIAKLRKGLTVADVAWLNNLPPDARLKIGQQLMLPNQSYLDKGREAKNKVLALSFYIQTHGGNLPPNVANPPSLEDQIQSPQNWKTVSKNGYTFSIDGLERTRKATGTIREDPLQKRSRTAQANAGRPDRLPSDQGGHYIARRFGGPTDAFNHFAQDGSFNQGAYRALENEWAAATRRGKLVWVRIIPKYDALSKRPSQISVEYRISGRKFWKTFPNRKKG